MNSRHHTPDFRPHNRCGPSLRRMLLAFVLGCGSVSCLATADCGASPSVTIVVSGETHAMVYPCDCPGEQVGGLAKRKTVLDTLRGAHCVLLVDGGGFAGGGPYDSYTEGRFNDSLRTLATLRAMAEMGYDAVAVGDDDLQYGTAWLAEQAARASLPLVCANCRSAAGAPFDRFVVVEKNGARFMVTALSTTAPIVDTDTAISFKEPVAALGGILAETENISDYQIVLAHVGEEKTAALASQFPQVDVFVNAHRKSSMKPVTEEGGRPVMHFGFQGKRLSFARMAPQGDHLRLEQSGWLDISRRAADDTAVAHGVAGVLKSRKSSPVVLDLYVMSDCSHGLDALREILPLAGLFDNVSFNLRLIGSVDSAGAVSSPQGEERAAQEKIWLAVERLYPEMWGHFLAIRSSSSAGVGEITRELGLDSSRIAQWVSQHGKEALAAHYRRSMRLGVEACPTLFYNGQPFGFEPTRLRVAKDLCAHANKPVPVCDSLPECFTDSDCRKPGKTGTCIAEGQSRRCSFANAVAFTLTVLVPDSSLFIDTAATIQTTRTLFSGVRVHTLTPSTRGGKRILSKVDPAALPLYLFDSRIEKTANWTRVKDGLKKVGKWYTFKETVQEGSCLYKRPAHFGTIVFIDPRFMGVEDALEVVLECDSSLATFEVLPIFHFEPGSKDVVGSELLNQQESFRWLVLQAFYRGRYAAYLKQYKRQAGDEYRAGATESIGVPGQEFEETAARNEALLAGNWQRLKELKIRGPVAVVYNNREVVAVGNHEELASILKRILAATGSARRNR